MDIQTCTHCKALVEGEGIRHRRRLFCSDECCETFEDQFLTHGGPDVTDLQDDEASDDDLFDEDDFLDDDDDDDDDDLEDDDF